MWLELYSLEKFSCDHIIQVLKKILSELKSNILLTPILTYIGGIITGFNIKPCRLDKEGGVFLGDSLVWAALHELMSLRTDFHLSAASFDFHPAGLKSPTRE